MRSAAAAIKYFEQTDLLASSPGEWLGKGAEMLGLDGSNNQDHFISLAHNLHPQTGEQLTTYTRDNRRVGVDMTFSAPKSISLARELANNEGDPRIEEAHREAVKYTMSLIEQDMQARVRKGGAFSNRTTGNLVAYRVTHRDTRINADDGHPDPQLHEHVFVFNASFDFVEKQWKAAEIAQIKKDAPFYEAIYASRLAANVKDLGYGIERRGKSFEITGISQELRDKFSRRLAYINMVAAKLGITNPESKAKLGATTRLGKTTELTDDLQSYYLSRLTPQEKQQLASLNGKLSRATTTEAAVAYAIGHHFERQSVVDERRLYETALRHGIGYVTPEGVQKEAKRQGLLVKNGEATTKTVLTEEARVIAFARDGKGTCRPMGVGSGVDVSTQRFGERIEHPQQASPLSTRVQAAAAEFDLATHPALDQQQKGRAEPEGSTRPLRGGIEPTVVPFGSTATGHRDPDTATPPLIGQQKGRPDESKRPMPALRQGFISDTATLPPEQQAVSATKGLQHDGSRLIAGAPKVDSLSPEQAAIARHVWNSPDRVILIRGAAGTGKTHTMKTTIAGIDRPVVVLAPSAEASRGVLRKEGFTSADTVSRFLIDQEFQHKAKNGVIWVDEAGLLGMRQTRQVFDIAEKLNARVVLQGDRQQHGSIERGTTLRVLEQFAGLPVAQLTDIRRQKGRYKEAVTALSKGKMLDGYDTLEGLGWVKSTTDNTPLVDEYMEAIDTKRSDQDITDRVLAIAPTHAEANEVTDAIRHRLQERGIVAKEEHEVHTLVPLHWTEAERGDLNRYEGTEVVQYHRNGGTQKAGQRVAISDFKPGMHLGPASTFSVYGKATIKLAAGDRIRITSPGKTADKKHKLDNGTQYQVKGFDEKGGIVLTNGWTLDATFKHLTHGYVTTSHASQGKTVDVVLIAMGKESLPAISAEQFYVSVSRGREMATVFTNVPSPELREAIMKSDTRKSATETFGHKRRYEWWRRARLVWERLRTRPMEKGPSLQHSRDERYAR